MKNDHHTMSACSVLTIFRVIALLLCCWGNDVLQAAPKPPPKVTVRTHDEANKEVDFSFRVPAGYNPEREERYRVLVLFGGRNQGSAVNATGRLGWGPWADRLGIFIVSPGYKNGMYWNPAAWSGQALMNALLAIRKQYRICTDKLLFYGYSAGGQCSNLFAAWKPEKVRAWASHASGVFFPLPDPRVKLAPGLVTCGDADRARYLLSRRFVQRCRAQGRRVLWKSFPNHGHDVPPRSMELARAFLEFYHELFKQDLSPIPPRSAALPPAPFVGDDLEEVFYPAGSPKIATIAAEDRVELPSRKVAEAWGKEAK